ncbi:hypothetical protein SNE40_002576 [Patella caerulea]
MFFGLKLMSPIVTPKLVAGYFMECIKRNNGCPSRVRIDKGTENNHIQQMQPFLRLDNSTLRLFLRYCTGSDMLNMDTIHVEMSPMPHFQRRPISHTRGFLFQLADQYDNFMEFRKEFDGVFHSQIWAMDFV